MEKEMDKNDHRIIGRELDLLMVTGRTEPVKTYELIKMINGGGDHLTPFLETYAEALQCYRTRQWNDAKKKFQEALRIRPDDHPSRLYIQRVAAFESNPPPDNWNGVFVMTSK